ncbi:V-type proton ATPase subunit F-like [Hydractinia symbiolongicarpus]|uniref:V-type proton ATPase subunit F-like n=1 Tax=Hydractinia symbiolongicarpus TaxID=13093 RepID=UPI00254B07A7|nr:V-type proton ATPase subunit F-like [Hydractinia symbiolongicarpus]
MAGKLTKGKLIAVIGDQDTCTGFLLGGIGEVNMKRQKNFFVVTKDSTIHEIEEAFNKFAARQDVAIILITQKIAEEIRHVIDNHLAPIPTVLEIPSKDFPYDSSKDSILKRAKGMFSADELR